MENLLTTQNIAKAQGLLSTLTDKLTGMSLIAWNMLLKKQYIDAWYDLSMIIFWGIIVGIGVYIAYYLSFKKDYSKWSCGGNNSEGASLCKIVPSIVMVLLAIAYVCISFSAGYCIIIRFVMPEYMAFRELLSLIQ